MLTPNLKRRNALNDSVMGSRDSESDTAVDADTFQQWVRHTAESRGMTEHELLNQLVSAFWALDEMGDIGLNSVSDPENSDRAGDRREEALRDENGADDRRSGTDGDETSEFPDSKMSEFPDSKMSEFPDSETSEPLDPDDLDPRDDLSSTEMELARRIAELRRQMADLSLDVEQQRSRQEEFTDRLSDDVTRLHSEIQSLESRVEQSDVDVENRIDDVEASLEDVEATQDEFEAWIDGEFDQIEALFDRVLDAVQGFDDRIEALEDAVDSVSATEQDREALEALRKQAIRKGIDSGQCENCGMAVDLSMLSEPSCPSCDEEFWDVEEAALWNPFSSPTLRTDGRPSRTPGRD
jgi:rubrerythrin